MPALATDRRTPAMRKQAVAQVCDVMSTLVESAGEIQASLVQGIRGVRAEFEITPRGRRMMAETLMAWLEDEGL